MSISYLKHEEIDKLKWDKCINRAFNGIVFAYSWYLDIVSFHWDALVFNDYEAVMPLTANKNYTLSSIKQPDFTPQLGIFTSKLLDVDLANSFLNAIPEKFRKVELSLNSFNKVSLENYQVKAAFVYELDIISPYKNLYLKFSDEIKEQIKLTKTYKIHVLKQVNLKEFLLLKKSTSKNPLTFENLNMLRRIIPFTISYNLGETYGAYDDKNELVAASFFIKSHQKAIQLLSACTPYGQSIHADVAILNAYLREYAERNITFGFYSSNYAKNEGFAKGFGAIPVKFLQVKKQNGLKRLLSKILKQKSNDSFN
jgi:hypothetical protein